MIIAELTQFSDDWALSAVRLWERRVCF